MPEWKKVIYSGSSAELKSAYLSHEGQSTSPNFHLQTFPPPGAVFGSDDDPTAWVNAPIYGGETLQAAPFSPLSIHHPNFNSPIGGPFNNITQDETLVSVATVEYLYALSDVNGQYVPQGGYFVLRTPRINLTGTTNRTLVFYAQMYESSNRLTVGYSTDNSDWASSTPLMFRHYIHHLYDFNFDSWSDWNTEHATPFNDATDPIFNPKWARVEVDLTPIPDEDVYLYIKFKVGTGVTAKGNLALCNIYLNTTSTSALRVDGPNIDFLNLPSADPYIEGRLYVQPFGPLKYLKVSQG